MHKAAIRNERIVGTEGNKIIFTRKDYKNRARKGRITQESGEFIRRFHLHNFPKGFCKIPAMETLPVNTESPFFRSEERN